MIRRKFLSNMAAGIAGITFLPGCRNSLKITEISKKPLRFGCMTDLHFADRDPAMGRYYRQGTSKATAAIDTFNLQNLDFIIETGDFKDQSTPADEKATISYLKEIENVFQKFNGPAYHALGNHDMDSISKQQFLANIKNTGISPDKSYYSFDSKGAHFIVLDANFHPDGTDFDHGNFNWTNSYIPDFELDWLKKDLAAAKTPVIVFNHQLLDGGGSHYVNNAADVRSILEDSEKVIAVFQGHQHKGDHSIINGIHYYTLKAMCQGPYPDNSAFAVVEINHDRINITGYADVEDRNLITKL